MDPRSMQRAMRSMGIKQSDVAGVTEVIIRTKDHDIVLTSPEVVCIEMKGSKSYQISGTEEIRAAGSAGTAAAPAEAAFPDEDIQLVMSQANCDRDKAVAALKETDGQPAEAIVKIMSE